MRQRTIPGRAFPKLSSASTKSSRRPRAARKSEPRTRSINQESLRQRRRTRTVSVPDAAKTLARSQSNVPPLLSTFNVDSANDFFALRKAKTMQTEQSASLHGWRTMSVCLIDRVGRTKAHPKISKKSACYSRHVRERGLRPLHQAAFKCNPRFLDPSHWHSRAGRRQPMLACFPVRNGQGQCGQCFSEAVDPLWRNLRGV